MAGRTIVERVKELVTPIVVAEHLELVDVEFKHEGPTNYLRLFIDKPGGVTIDDCQQISRDCEVVLDVEEVIQTQYVLEVSSPGLDRPLKAKADYQRFQNRLVKLKTFQAIQGRKSFVGHLREMIAETATSPLIVKITTLDGEDLRIPYELIAAARLEVEF